MLRLAFILCVSFVACLPCLAHAQERKLPELSANLDGLLNFTELWQWTAEDFEKNYVLKLEDQTKQQKPPQFEWVNASRDRARFSRHMYSNVETKLTMFGGSIKVEEAILEFVGGKAAMATISFYNRGDSGDIEAAEFDRMFKQIGQNLGQVMQGGIMPGIFFTIIRGISEFMPSEL